MKITRHQALQKTHGNMETPGSSHDQAAAGDWAHLSTPIPHYLSFSNHSNLKLTTFSFLFAFSKMASVDHSAGSHDTGMGGGGGGDPPHRPNKLPKGHRVQSKATLLEFSECMFPTVRSLLTYI